MCPRRLCACATHAKAYIVNAAGFAWIESGFVHTVDRYVNTALRLSPKREHVHGKEDEAGSTKVRRDGCCRIRSM